MDEEGTAGKAYGARTTPHMYIVDPQGKLVYAGGIDSIPSSKPDDIKKAINYVQPGPGRSAGRQADQRGDHAALRLLDQVQVLSLASAPGYTGAMSTISELRRILATCRTIAVVGLSPQWHRPSFFAAKYMQEHGYRIVPVNPAATEILGQRCYPSVTAAAALARRA